MPTSLQTTSNQRFDSARKKVDHLVWRANERQKQLVVKKAELDEAMQYLELAPEVTDALESLSNHLFARDLEILEEKLSIALSEVLKQPIRFQAELKFKSNYANVEFSVQRDDNKEDVRRGQGGSVHNVLSVGLRMFALTTLDPNQHRRFLVLDEQDCWLQRELVPHLVKIVHDAGKELGYQVIMISHHELSLFEEYADKIYRFIPRNETQETKDGERKVAYVDVELVGGEAMKVE